MIQTSVDIPRPGDFFVPVGSEITSSTPMSGYITASLSLADYDYSSFDDPGSPAFEFVADVVRVAADGSTSIDRGVACISSPGRITREKE